MAEQEAAEVSVEQEPNSDALSVHRIFFYATSAPGYGEYKAGFLGRGIVTGLAFGAFFVWFTLSLWQVASLVSARLAGMMTGTQIEAVGEISFAGISIAVIGMYFVWAFGMIGSVDLAVGARRESGEKPQRSVPWAVGMTYLCPGCGQVYVGARQWGFTLFAAFLLGIVLVIPDYYQLCEELQALLQAGKSGGGASTEAIWAKISLATARLEFGFGSLFQLAVWMFAAGETLHVLRENWHPLEASNFVLRARPYLGLALIGYICPGGPQLLQRKQQQGWALIAAFVGIYGLIGLLLSLGIIETYGAAVLMWGATFVTWYSVGDAVWRHHQSLSK